MVETNPNKKVAAQKDASSQRKSGKVPHPSKVTVRNAGLKPYMVCTSVKDPQTLETEQIRVDLWPGEHPLPRAHAEAALSCPWLTNQVKHERGQDAEISDVFTIKDLMVDASEVEKGDAV